MSKISLFLSLIVAFAGGTVYAAEVDHSNAGNVAATTTAEAPAAAPAGVVAPVVEAAVNGSVVVTDAYVNVPAEKHRRAVRLYMNVENKAEHEDVLLSATTPAAKKVRLRHKEEGHPRSKGFKIAAGGALRLSPEGSYIVLIDVDHSAIEEGKTFPVKLKFEKAGEIETQVVVKK